MDRNKLKNTLKERIKLMKENDGSDYGQEKCREVFLQIAFDDWDGFAAYLINEADVDEMLVLTEIMFDATMVLGKEKVLPVMKKAADRYPEESREYYVYDDIKRIESDDY